MLTNSLVGNLGILGVALSKNADYLAIGGSISPYLSVFKRLADDSFSPITIASPPTFWVTYCKFSDDGNYLVLGLSNPPRFSLYSRSGDNFTKIADPAILTASPANTVSINNTNTLVAVGYSSGFNVYTFDGTILTRILGIPGPGFSAACSAFSPDGNYFAISYSVSLKVYSVSGTTFTALTVPPSLNYVINGLDWDSTSTYLATSSSNYIELFKVASTTVTKVQTLTLAANEGSYSRLTWQKP